MKKKSSTVPVARIPSESEQTQETTESKVKNEQPKQPKYPIPRIPSEHHIKHVVAAPKVKKSEVWLKAWLAVVGSRSDHDIPNTFSWIADECVKDYFERFGDG